MMDNPGVWDCIKLTFKYEEYQHHKTTHLTQLIDTRKIYKYLDYLCEMGHPSYKFYGDWNTYQNRCSKEDPRGSKLIFPVEEDEIVDLEFFLEHLGGTVEEKSITEQVINNDEKEVTEEEKT